MHDLQAREMVILGSQYAGEMKKGIFTVMHYLMPKRGILSVAGCGEADESQCGENMSDVHPAFLPIAITLH